ncbi:hypothetical protein DEF24_14030, partial [Marinitenerispora sediminis]
MACTGGPNIGQQARGRRAALLERAPPSAVLRDDGPRTASDGHAAEERLDRGRAAPRGGAGAEGRPSIPASVPGASRRRHGNTRTSPSLPSSAWPGAGGPAVPQ